MAHIALLGTGAMGSRVALNFLKAGHSVTVYNRSPERATALVAAGAVLAATPREAAAAADIVISMVRDDVAARAVWLAADGAVSGLQSGAVAIESSTVSPDWIAELAPAVHSTGAALLDAPVLGTRPQADAAQLVYVVGGAVAVLERVAPVLQATSSAIHHIGPSGAGAYFKLAVNAQYSAQVAVWAETLAILARYGIALDAAVGVLNTLPTTSPALQVAGKLIAAQQYAPMFPIELVEKDLAYALAAAHTVDVQTPTLAGTHALYANALARGHGAENIVAVARVFAQALED